MNWFDYLLVAIVGCSGALAVLRGLVREGMALLGWVVGFVVASHLAGRVTRFLSRWAGGSQVAPPSIVGGVGAFLVLFLMSLLVMTLVGRLAHSLVGGAGLSVADRVLGLTFGLARGVFVILVGFLAFKLFNLSEPAWMSNSLLTPICHAGVAHLVGWLPQDFPLLERLEGGAWVGWQQDQWWTPPAPW